MTDLDKHIEKLKKLLALAKVAGAGSIRQPV